MTLVCFDGMDESVMDEVKSLLLLGDHSDLLLKDTLNMMNDGEGCQVVVDSTALNAGALNYPPMNSYYFCRAD